MIDFLHERGMDLSQTTIIGHSLGAHVAGLAARNAKGEVEVVIGKFFFIYTIIIQINFSDDTFSQRERFMLTCISNILNPSFNCVCEQNEKYFFFAEYYWNLQII